MQPEPLCHTDHRSLITLVHQSIISLMLCYSSDVCLKLSQFSICIHTNEAVSCPRTHQLSPSEIEPPANGLANSTSCATAAQNTRPKVFTENTFLSICSVKESQKSVIRCLHILGCTIFHQ